MKGITELIDEAIAKLADQPSVFTLADVAAYADLMGRDHLAIERALREHCANQHILDLSAECYEASGARNYLSQVLRQQAKGDARRYSRRYLGTIQVEHWWIGSTLRWAKAGVGWMNPVELARAMSLAFDTKQWDTVPNALVKVGRRWATVAEGYYHDTFTFPWATAIHCNPQLADGLRSIYGFGPLDCGTIIDDVLRSLTARESDIVKRRGGLGTGPVETLEQLGISYAVTRERIRQIEQKAWRKLAHPARQQSLRYAFASDFMQTRGSLLIDESAMTPLRKFLHRAIGLSTIRVPELSFHFIGTESDVKSYRVALRDIDAYLDSATDVPHFESLGLLRFLSKEDGDRVNSAEQTYRPKQVTKTRPRMVRDALRSLGRAAHFEEIADACNRMFPGNQASTHNWHAAMGRPDAEALGIVWIGRKGMYGLKEHGYSRPDTDLFDGAAKIVETIFGRTNRPVSQETVIAEMSKQRRELHHNSVAMALSLNDRLESVGRGEYVPRPTNQNTFAAIERAQYDIDAAFDAFLSTDDDDV